MMLRAGFGPGAARVLARAAALFVSALAVLAAVAPPAAAIKAPFGVPIGRLHTTERVIALSFDDGPQATPMVDSLLAILASRRAHGTFFVIGEELARVPDVGRRLLAAGDELGNHSWTHPRLDSLSLDSVRTELGRTDSLLRAVGARGRILVRPPYGAFNATVANELKRRHRVMTLFDVDPEYDLPAGTPADTTIEYTLRLLGPGSIVVLHPWYDNGPAMLATLPRILDRLTGMGYRLVTVSELLRVKHAVVQPAEYHEIMK